MTDVQTAQIDTGTTAPTGDAGAATATAAGPSSPDFPAVADPLAVDAGGMGAVDPGFVSWAQGFLEAGGPVVAILGVLSVVALAIVLVKLWQFAVCRVGDRKTARRALALYRSGHTIEAIGVASKSRNPVAEVLAYTLRGCLRRDLDEALVREEAARLASERIEALRSYLRALEVIASISPLLGLFGTVLGMIEAFQQLQGAGSQVNPAILSGGIWEALLTTAVGLAVAMPVVVVLAWLERIVEGVTHEMETIVTQVFTRDLAGEPAPREHASETLHDLARLRPAALVADR